VPHPTSNVAEAEANSEFVERLDDDCLNTGLIVIAKRSPVPQLTNSEKTSYRSYFIRVAEKTVWATSLQR
jgi:hypothetical protein